MTSKPAAEFSNDSPLFSKVDDQLNRAPFAERIASVLRGLPKGAGLVVGIHGPWGDGKTTVLNLLKVELEHGPEMALVEFNPWRFTDELSMLDEFFRVLAGVIRAKLSTKAEDIAGLIERVGRYAKVVDSRLGTMAEVAGAKAGASLEELRSRLSEELLKSEQRVVVLVDDIDRLDKHETYTLFRLIKACADFPNVSYVLAFDDVAVSKMLGERYGSGDAASGRAFLEKIIQVPLNLPIAMKEDLRSLCFRQIERALTSSEVELSREEISGLVSGFDRGISIRLDTPRAAKRYGNALMFALPMLKGEVNTVDLLLIEAVRAFYPSVYELIRAHHADFCGVESEYRSRATDGPRGVARLKPIMDILPDEEQAPLKSLLKQLFPRLGNAYGGGGFGSDWLGSWAKARRICSPDYCSRYFTYAIPMSDLRVSEMDLLYRMAAEGDVNHLRDKLESHFVSGKARRVIERLREGENNTSPEVVPGLCLALAASGKYIPNQPSLFSFGEPPSQAAILIANLISRLPAGTDRVDLAKKVVTTADPLWFAGECLRWLNVTDDADKADRSTLTKEEVKKVAEALVERAKARSAAGELLFDVEIAQEQSLLYEWCRVEGREAVQAHLSALFEADSKNISLFLQTMAPRAWCDGDVLPRVGELDGNQLKSIKFLFDLDALADLILKHLPGDFLNPQWLSTEGTSLERRLAEQFMFVYNTWKKDGEPPDAESGK